MPSTSFAFNNEIFTTTLFNHSKKIVDALDYDLPLLKDMASVHGAGKPSTTGSRLNVNLGFGEHSEPTELTSGYEPINYTITEQGTPGMDDWADIILPVVIAGHEKRLNSGAEHKLLDILKERTKAAVAGLRRRLHKRLWGLVNTGLTDINTVNGMDNSDGFLESAAIGSQTNIIHLISKATYNFAPGWQNFRGDGAGSFNTNGLSLLDQLVVHILTLRGTSQKAGRLYASQAAYRHLKRAVRTNERYLTEATLDTGHPIMAFADYPVIPNRDMPNAGTATTADPWSFAFIDHDAIQLKTHGSDWFRTGAALEQSGYDVQAAPIHLMCQLMTDYLGSSGILVDLEAW